MSPKKRVVITGLSALSPLGNNLSTTWEKLLASASGISNITRFDTGEYATKIAGEVKNFNPDLYINPKEARRMDRFVQFAVVAAKMLMENSGYIIQPELSHRIGVMLGVGLGGLETLETFHTKLTKAGPNKISPFMIPMLISNMAPGQVSIFTGAKGTNVVMTSACSSGLHAIGYAYLEILLSRCEAMISGGVESTITPMGVSGFTALKALSASHNDSPSLASRPFDKNRDGFVIGEGAGFVMLESLDNALARNAKIYAEIVGFGASGDAFHITAPHEEGEGMYRAMLSAIQDAGIKPEQVDHINAHGTSTYLNDLIETKAIKQLFGKHAYNIAICANKSQTGHLLGAAGGLESIFSIKTLETGIIPGTLNYTTPDPDCDLNYMGDGPKKLDPTYVLCNSAGFGGTNVSILYKHFEK